MKPSFAIALIVLAGVNIINLVMLIGWKPTANDRPFVFAKTATEENWQQTMADMCLDYHSVQTREKMMILAGYISATVSTVMILLAVSALRNEKIEQSGPENPIPSGTSDAKASGVPDSRGLSPPTLGRKSEKPCCWGFVKDSGQKHADESRAKKST